MREWESQSHVRWYCRYHIVIVPKYRRKAIFGALRRELGPILKDLCKRYGVELIEGHVMTDHVHMLLSIPPKFSIANIIGKLKGKSTILINQKYVKQRNFRGLHSLRAMESRRRGRVVPGSLRAGCFSAGKI